MMPNTMKMDKLYYKSNEDGELYELGPTVDLIMHSEPGCIVHGTIEFRVNKDTFQKTKDFVKETPVFTITDKGLTFYDKDGAEIGGFTSDGVRPKDCIEVSQLYPNMMIVDTEAEETFNKFLQKRIKDKKENFKMENIKLLTMYEKEAKAKIEDAFRTEVKETVRKNSLYTRYNELVDEFEKRMEILFESQTLGEYPVIAHSGYANNYKYDISSDFTRNIENELSKKYSDMKLALDEKISEIKAQLELAQTCGDDSNKYYLMNNILTDYGILDSKGRLAKYELPVEKEVVEEPKEEVKTTAPKKRGRKPKTQKEK